MKEKLLANVGKTVTVENHNYYHGEDDKFSYIFAGKLEYSEEYPDNFYVRVGEDYTAGSMGVTFQLKDVYKLDKRVYGELRIVLK